MNFEINTEIRTKKIKKKEIKRTPINIFWFRRKFSILKTTIWIEINLSVRSDLKRNGYLFDMMKKKTFYHSFLQITPFILDDPLYINSEHTFLV